ncbi:MAG: rhamnan synthesis F family protein [Micropepsaceae bacterium]
MSSNDAKIGKNDGTTAGAVESCRDGVLVGWAEVPGLPMVPAVVDFVIDNQPAGSAKANLMRADLRARGIRDGFAGFQFKVPAPFLDGNTHRLVATERVSRRVLQGLSLIRDDTGRERMARAAMFTQGAVLAHSTSDSTFLDQLHTRRRLAVFCTYTPDHLMHGQHHWMIRSLRDAGFDVLLVQGFDRNVDHGAHTTALAAAADAYIAKDNVGYDFGSWFAALTLLGNEIGKLDELLLVNDSIFGPFRNGASLRSLIDQDPSDVLGMCDSYEHNYHLQSFFLLFRQRILRSGAVNDFASAYPFSENKRDVIREGELSLTTHLQKAGYSCAALFAYDVMARKWLDQYEILKDAMPADAAGILSSLAIRIRNGEPVNPCHFFWEMLINSGCPFIKRELILKNPMAVPQLNRAAGLIRSSGYPLAHIKEAAQRYGATRVLF